MVGLLGKYHLDEILHWWYKTVRVWQEPEVTDEWLAWYQELPDEQSERVDALVDLLWQKGHALRRPHVGDIEGSRLDSLKELIVGGGDFHIESSSCSIRGVSQSFS